MPPAWPRWPGHSPSDHGPTWSTVGDVIAIAKQLDAKRLTLSQRAWKRATERQLCPLQLSRAAHQIGCKPEALARAIAMGVVHE